jgi:hypothetical protein
MVDLYKDNPEQRKIPHIYAVADDAYQSMIRTKDNQVRIAACSAVVGCLGVVLLLLSHTRPLAQ